jgi:hypothetical protein
MNMLLDHQSRSVPAILAVRPVRELRDIVGLLGLAGGVWMWSLSTMPAQLHQGPWVFLRDVTPTAALVTLLAFGVVWIRRPRVLPARLRRVAGQVPDPRRMLYSAPNDGADDRGVALAPVLWRRFWGPDFEPLRVARNGGG